MLLGSLEAEILWEPGIRMHVSRWKCIADVGDGQKRRANPCRSR